MSLLFDHFEKAMLKLKLVRFYDLNSAKTRALNFPNKITYFDTSFYISCIADSTVYNEIIGIYYSEKTDKVICKRLNNLR